MRREVELWDVFIAYPDSLLEDKEIVKTAIDYYNSAHADRGIHLVAKDWKKDVYPSQKKSAQEHINDEAIKDADIIIGLIGLDLGSSSEKDVSGTVEEIQLGIELGKEVIVCFKNLFDSERHTLTPVTLKNFNELKERFNGLYIDYKKSNLQREISHKLGLLVRNVKKKDYKKLRLSSEEQRLLILLCLIGRWDGNSDKETRGVENLTGLSYAVVIQVVDQIIASNDNIFRLKDDSYIIKNRKQLWKELGVSQKITKEDLKRFQELAIETLSEIDEALFLTQIYIHSYDPTVYSKSFKSSIVDTLALLGTNTIGNISTSSEYLVGEILKNIFSNGDWKLLGSLDSYMPTLAEASPQCFLDIVENIIENSIENSSEKLTQILSINTQDIFDSRPNLHGLYWALEVVAWGKDYFVQSCICLAKLDSLNTGNSRFTNSPANSLSTILLPWHPRTYANIEKRKSIVNILNRDYPTVFDKILPSFLPNVTTMSIATYEPRWRDFNGNEISQDVTNEEYWDFVEFCAEYIFQKAMIDFHLLQDMLKNIDNIIYTATLDKLINFLLSEKIDEYSEDERRTLWEAVMNIYGEHKYFKSEKWSMPDEYLNKIFLLYEKLMPPNIFYKYRHLFNSDELFFYKESVYKEGKSSSYNEFQNKIAQLRKKAVSEIYENGITEVIRFAKNISDSWHQGNFGHILAEISQKEIDDFILPKYLNESHSVFYFASSYARKKKEMNGWEWFDGRSFSDWSTEEKGNFLLSFSLDRELINRIESLLDKKENYYWGKINSCNFPVFDDNFDLDIVEYILQKMLLYNRPFAGIEYLSQINSINKNLLYKINTDIILRLLDKGATDNNVDRNQINLFSVFDIFKYLENTLSLENNKLFDIEFKYIALYSFSDVSRLRALEYKIITKASVFCEIISLVYKSDKKDEKKNQIENIEERKDFLKNLWKILHKKNLRIGLIDDVFDADLFLSWIKEVKRISEKTGHLRKALYTIGENLINIPNDNDYVVLNEIVLNELNKNEEHYDQMRKGYYLGIINSRGVYTVDPSGQPEDELSAKYSKQADEIENLGFDKVARVFRDIAYSYERDAIRVREESKLENEYDNDGIV